MVADGSITTARGNLDRRANALSAPTGPIKRSYRRIRTAGAVRQLGAAATRKGAAASALGKATRKRGKLQKRITKADDKIVKYR